MKSKEFAKAILCIKLYENQLVGAIGNQLVFFDPNTLKITDTWVHPSCTEIYNMEIQNDSVVTMDLHFQITLWCHGKIIWTSTAIENIITCYGDKIELDPEGVKVYIKFLCVDHVYRFDWENGHHERTVIPLHQSLWSPALCFSDPNSFLRMDTYIKGCDLYLYDRQTQTQMARIPFITRQWTWTSAMLYKNKIITGYYCLETISLWKCGDTRWITNKDLERRVQLKLISENHF